MSQLKLTYVSLGKLLYFRSLNYFFASRLARQPRKIV